MKLVIDIPNKDGLNTKEVEEIVEFMEDTIFGDICHVLDGAEIKGKFFTFKREYK